MLQRIEGQAKSARINTNPEPWMTQEEEEEESQSKIIPKKENSNQERKSVPNDVAYLVPIDEEGASAASSQGYAGKTSQGKSKRRGQRKGSRKDEEDSAQRKGNPKGEKKGRPCNTKLTALYQKLKEGTSGTLSDADAQLPWILWGADAEGEDIDETLLGMTAAACSSTVDKDERSAKKALSTIAEYAACHMEGFTPRTVMEILAALKRQKVRASQDFLEANSQYMHQNAMKFSARDLASFSLALCQFISAEQFAPLLEPISCAVVRFPAQQVLTIQDVSQLLHVLGQNSGQLPLAESYRLQCSSDSSRTNALIRLFGVASTQMHKASPEDFAMICGVIAAMWPSRSGSCCEKLKREELSFAISAAHKDAMTAYRFQAAYIPWSDFVATSVALVKCSPDDIFWDSFKSVVNHTVADKPLSLQMQSVKHLTQLVQVCTKMPPGNCCDGTTMDVLFEAAKAKLESFTDRDVASLAKSMSRLSDRKGRELLHLLLTSALRFASAMEAADVVQLFCALGPMAGDSPELRPDDAWTRYKPLICRLLRRLLTLWQRQVPKDMNILSELLWALAKLQPAQDNADISQVLRMVLPVVSDAGVISQAGPRQLAKMAWGVSELLRFREVLPAPCIPAAWKSLRAELWTRDLDAFMDHDLCLSVLGIAQYITNMAATPRYGEDKLQRILAVSGESEHGEDGTSGEVFSRLTAEIESRWMANIGNHSADFEARLPGMLVSAFEAVGRSVPKWVTMAAALVDDGLHTEPDESTKSRGQDVYQ